MFFNNFFEAVSKKCSTITYSRLTIESQEQGVKHIQS